MFPVLQSFRTALFAATATVACMIGTLAHAQASTYPAIRLIVAYPTGGTTDAVARALADKLGAQLGQSVVVENKGGGQVATDAAGGQFELLTTNPNPAINALIKAE